MMLYFRINFFLINPFGGNNSLKYADAGNHNLEG